MLLFSTTTVFNAVTFLSLLELTFAWIFNEYPYFVQQDSRRFISQETGSLYIAKVEPSDVGNYTCVVTNTVTKTRVQGPPTPLVLRSDGEIQFYDNHLHPIKTVYSYFICSFSGCCAV
jgi:hypothetical protein